MDIIKLNFDQLKKDHWSEQETANAKLILEFVQRIMNNHEFDLVLKEYSNGKYKQHNRNMNEGIPGVVENVQELSGRFPDFTYDVKHILVDGDYVTFHSHATVNKKHRGNDKMGFNIMDTWKVQNGQIVEHWDAIQPLNAFMRFYMWLTGGTIRNANGVF